MSHLHLHWSGVRWYPRSLILAATASHNVRFCGAKCGIALQVGPDRDKIPRLLLTPLQHALLLPSSPSLWLPPHPTLVPTISVASGEFIWIWIPASITIRPLRGSPSPPPSPPLNMPTRSEYGGFVPSETTSSDIASSTTMEVKSRLRPRLEVGSSLARWNRGSQEETLSFSFSPASSIGGEIVRDYFVDHLCDEFHHFGYLKTKHVLTFELLNHVLT